MIGIIDYGMGNLHSVTKAFEHLGFSAKVLNEANMLDGVSHVVLPGVGAFADAMSSLEHAGWVPAIQRQIDAGKPFLGICLGMQLLFEGSQEGDARGLGIFSGWVRHIPPGRKIPHMGWNRLQTRPSLLFAGLPEEPYAYFVHSYAVDTTDNLVIARAEYDGFSVTAAVGRDNVFATQFHPEKSSEAGLAILRNFGGLL